MRAVDTVQGFNITKHIHMLPNMLQEMKAFQVVIIQVIYEPVRAECILEVDAKKVDSKWVLMGRQFSTRDFMG